MSVQSAAIQLLKQAGKPLHVNEIAKLIIDSGLWKPDGKTLEATVIKLSLPSKSKIRDYQGWDVNALDIGTH